MRGDKLAPMPLIYLLKGLIIGFSLAAPIGPIGILCLRGSISSMELDVVLLLP